jgi:hypothetical protein
MICDHRAADDIVVSDARKRRELARLLESEARHAIVGLNWLLSPDPPERVRRTLLENFHPVRVYRSVAVLERGRDETMNRLLEVQKRLALGRPRRGDVSFVEKVTRSHPEEPYPWALLGVLTRARTWSGPRPWRSSKGATKRRRGTSAPRGPCAPAPGSGDSGTDCRQRYATALGGEMVSETQRRR